MKKAMKRLLAATSAGAVLCGSLALSSLLGSSTTLTASAATDSVADQTKVGTLGIAGGGFVSGIITGKNVMYARTDVGGAYKYNYDTGKWDQMLSDLNDSERGFLSVDAMCIDPTDDDTIYLLCGCAYFSDAKTEIFRSRDGGKTFDRIDVTDMIQVHGNGDGRHLGEAIAVDPDNPNIIYCGGDVTAGDSALIMSKDGGDTWEAVKGYDDLGFYTNSIKWPLWTNHMTRALTSGEYNTQNGVALIHIQDGKVYVGTTMAKEGNLVVADVGSDDFEVVSKDLPTDVYPSRIATDANGKLLITYVAAPAFGNGSGGIYRYDPKTGTVENISPVNNSFGACVSAVDNADELIATTCAVWSSQSWNSTSTAWGEWLYRSSDGGKTWSSIYPGKMGDWKWDEATGNMTQEQLYGYLNDGGRPWIQGKAIHWSGSLVLNPEDPTQIFVTSGNGVFDWSNIWSDNPQATFHADGIEEVVALDMVSAKGKNPYSAIGDYDGFEHISTTESKQHQPNIGSTAAIAYCPSNPDVMIRAAQNDGKTYYTLDGGDNWVEMNGTSGGGKAAITELADGTYRFFRSNNSGASYSDDFGATWEKCSGTKGTKELALTVDLENPQYVYGYTAVYNEYWSSDTTKSEPTFEDAHYVLMVSDDYGATFTTQDIGKYDQCDVANRIGYLDEGEMVLGAGWNGAYHVTDYGKKVEKLDNVFYCKTIGYGAPEEEGGVNTLYMYGKPSEDDIEGIYRSTDAGETWVAINLHHLYGGTGNGNFLVGDMNKFGMVYMSTVGCGIVYMDSSDGTDPKPVTTTTTTATTTTTTTATLTTTKAADTTTTDKGTTTTAAATTTTDKGTTTTAAATTTTNKGTTTSNAVTTTQDIGEMNYGDVNVNGVVDLTDAVLLNKFLAGIVQLTDIQYANANCDQTDGTDNVGELDTTALMRFVLNVEGYQELPYIAQD